MSEPVRQGEIMLLPVQAVVQTGSREAVRSYIVGHSESGHHHVLDCDREFDVIVGTDGLLIELSGTAQLVHQADVDRHNTLIVEPGIYRVLRKRQYDPVLDIHGPASD
ncbi:MULTISPECIES: hypothetical protein [Mycolicibacterium]|uniref:Uncharacterized protein n=1 Tax=Mycolicibacterium vanbaalenii (strain DSM 7251 / JCM 13017 / BCRC 16820 / KCTC 9966 / NRRL B-24157 / PYR-1) TaxID=350058 RepID=A1THQ7_MYCVP|nr:hypothetical protein [Mycolicibacterium vanbaalenii]ABM16707.1 hypothetical protein Mvan_5948 [Mycolicibacterium vanbaalenii PYR-1]MCV7130321.1 hypothetical protein [Mycolicibacterium vanbaalenii PYR-1]